MTDLAQSDVHGPVATVQTEATLLRFRPDGKFRDSESHDSDGTIARILYIYDEAGRLIERRFQQGQENSRNSIYYSYDSEGRLIRTASSDEKGTRTEFETCHYDSSGRKTKIQFLPKHEGTGSVSYDLEGTGAWMMMTGGAAATMTISYGDHDQPIEVLAHDSEHRLLARKVFTYDTAGRRVKEEVHRGAAPAFAGFEEALHGASPEDLEHARATIEKVFGGENGIVTMTYAYDQKGRRTEKAVRMGILSEEHTTYLFDDHDNPVEEISEGSNRDMGLDDQGNLQSNREDAIHQHTRFSYTYDTHGNWTERIVWSIFPPEKDFRQSNVERRQITYYPAAAA